MTAERWKLYEQLWQGRKPFQSSPYLAVPFDQPLSKEVITNEYGILPEYQNIIIMDSSYSVLGKGKARLAGRALVGGVRFSVSWLDKVSRGGGVVVLFGCFLLSSHLKSVQTVWININVLKIFIKILMRTNIIIEIIVLIDYFIVFF